MKAETTAVRLEDYRAPDFAIDAVNLDFRLDPQKTRVTAKLAVRPRSQATDLALVGDELALLSVSINGEALAADRTVASPDQLVIRNVPDRPFSVEIVTEIDPTANTKLMGLYRSNGTYCHQCEAE